MSGFDCQDMNRQWLHRAALGPFAQMVTETKQLHLGLFRHLQCIVHLDAEVSHRAFQLGVSEQ